MNQVVSANIIRFVFIALLQVLVLKRIDLAIGDFAYIHLLIYPYLILLLPFKTNRLLVLIIAFILGLFIDMFYNSPGVHTAAIVIMAYGRSYVLNILEPYEGYNQGDSPTLKTMGIGWFMSYLSIGLLIFMVAYFSLDAFSFIYIFDIIISSIFAFIPSLFLIMMLQILFNPTY